MRMRIVAVTLLVLGVGSATRGEDTRCMYDNEFFSSGDVSCQSGQQFRCVAGSWKPLGLTCSDTAAEHDEEGLTVHPSVRQPKVKDPSVKGPAVNQPPPPDAPQD